LLRPRDVEGRERRDSHEGLGEGRGGRTVDLVVAAGCSIVIREPMNEKGEERRGGWVGEGVGGLAPCWLLAPREKERGIWLCLAILWVQG
jgi:hypothetical protein